MRTLQDHSKKAILGWLLRWSLWALATLGLVLIPTAVSAGTIKVAWDAVGDPDLAGYKVYYGTSPGVYTNSTSVSRPQTSADLLNLQDCRIYYMAVKAFDANGNESTGFSNEITGMPAPVPTSLTPNQVKQATNAQPITIYGNNFDTQARPDFGPDILVNSYSTTSCTQMMANITITEAARVNSPGPKRTLKIINQSGPVGSNGNGIFGVAFNERRADVDGSGRVGARDLLYWQNAFGSVAGESNYNVDVDLNGDGLVDGTDLSLLAVWHGHIFF